MKLNKDLEMQMELENKTGYNNVYNSLLKFVVLRQIKLNLNSDFSHDKSYD